MVSPWPRKTRSSASEEKGMPVDWSSSTNAWFRAGGFTEPGLGTGWKKASVR